MFLTVLYIIIYVVIKSVRMSLGVDAITNWTRWPCSLFTLCLFAAYCFVFVD